VWPCCAAWSLGLRDSKNADKVTDALQSAHATWATNESGSIYAAGDANLKADATNKLQSEAEQSIWQRLSGVDISKDKRASGSKEEQDALHKELIGKTKSHIGEIIEAAAKDPQSDKAQALLALGKSDPGVAMKIVNDHIEDIKSKAAAAGGHMGKRDRQDLEDSKNIREQLTEQNQGADNYFGTVHLSVDDALVARLYKTRDLG
jgi:hypothetical protein